MGFQPDSRSAARILRKRAVVERTGISDTTRWRLIQRGEFPKPIKLSAQAVGWLESEIDAWIATRAATRS